MDKQPRVGVIGIGILGIRHSRHFQQHPNAEMVAVAVEEERFLVLTDEIAQTWMNYKTQDLELGVHRPLAPRFHDLRGDLGWRE